MDIEGIWKLKWKFKLGICLLIIWIPAINSVINVAWMGVAQFTYFFNASTALGALAYSKNEIEADTALLPGETFDVRWKDSGCNSKAAVGAMFDFMEDAAFPPDMFLGPICSGAMAPVGQLAAYLNKPVFGWITSDPPLADKTLYSTLVRFLWSINTIGDGIAILCREAGWKRVSIISTEGSDYGVLANGVREVLLADSADGFTVQRWISGIEEKPSQEKIKESYNLVKNEARIIILVVPEAELRNWTLGAFDSGLADGEYVMIYTNQQTPDENLYNYFAGRDFWEVGDGRDEDVLQMYQNFIMVIVRMLAFTATDQYIADFYAAAQAWVSPPVPPAPPDFYSLFLYDAMKVYARYATSTGTVNDGTTIFNAARNSLTTDGGTGDIILSDTCDRIPDYWFFDMSADGHFEPVAETVATLSGTTITRNMQLIGNKDFRWVDDQTGLDNAPPDVPKCGFSGELCQNTAIYWAPPVVIVIIIIIICVIVFVYRKWKYEHDLNSLMWKLNYDDMNIYMGNKLPGSQLNLRTQSAMLGKSRASVGDSLAGEQLYITVANYKGTIVAIRKVRKPQGVKLDRELLQELKRMTEMKHNNLNTFMGACVDTGKEICCVWEYCTKGSLQDVIYNDQINLEDMFKFSICVDILKGLSYLHESSLRVHGQLKSSNVVIDSRWACKLTDFGMEEFCKDEEPDPEMSDYAKFTRLLWTSPEILRESASNLGDIESLNVSCRCHSAAGDIYAAAIIMKETFCRNSAYHEQEDHYSPKEIVYKVMSPESKTYFRPDLSSLNDSLEAKAETSNKLQKLITKCWTEDPIERPTAAQALKSLKKINPSKKTNVVDNMMAMMEKYSSHLEEIVASRTLELNEEKKKTEDLLFKMLPKSVAEDLKHGKNIEAESYEAVTIYFSDIPGFGELVTDCTPLQPLGLKVIVVACERRAAGQSGWRSDGRVVSGRAGGWPKLLRFISPEQVGLQLSNMVVDILNGVYGLMDETINNHDVYKVETVGDVYVLVSGLPIRNGDRHIVEVVNCSLDLISNILAFKVPHRPKHQLSIRIGINTGPIVTGVVGLTNPRYCLFGDTMNTASRMESNGKALRIHLSPTSYAALSKFGGYHLANRGEIPVKGKGMMNTYWLMGKEGYTSKLPDYHSQLSRDQPKPTFMPPTSGKSTNPKILRPSAESGFVDLDSRKNSTISNGNVNTAKHSVTSDNPPLLELNFEPIPTSNIGMPVVDVTSNA